MEKYDSERIRLFNYERCLRFLQTIVKPEKSKKCRAKVKIELRDTEEIRWRKIEGFKFFQHFTSSRNKSSRAIKKTCLLSTEKVIDQKSTWELFSSFTEPV